MQSGERSSKWEEGLVPNCQQHSFGQWVSLKVLGFKGCGKAPVLYQGTTSVVPQMAAN